jgi:hypothetical protein
MALYLGGSNYLSIISSDGCMLKDSNGMLLAATAFSGDNKVKIRLNNVTYRLNVNLTAKESE